MTTKKQEVMKLVIRTLLHRELSGYDLYREMLAKSVKIPPNYLYMILKEMESSALLSTRWVETSKGPRRHLYSLDEEGREEFRRLVKDALILMTDAYVQANLEARDGRDHANSIKRSFDVYGVPYPGKGDKVVIATPSFDPLLCVPLTFRVMSELFPSSTIVVVKPAGMRFYDELPNVTFLDGRRQDMPLKEGFADCLMVEGLPPDASASETIRECARVLKTKGHLLLRVPKVMTEEQRPKFTNFAEFAMKQYFDLLEPGRRISLEKLQDVVSANFQRHGQTEFRGNVVIHAHGKKAQFRPRESRDGAEVDIPLSSRVRAPVKGLPFASRPFHRA